MPRSLRAGSLLALAALPLCPQQQPVIRVNVNLVRVIATVKDNYGQIIGNLRQEDFEILDNGKPQAISVFEHHTEQPLSVAMMIDTSGSTAIEFKYEKDSVTRFFKSLFIEGNPRDAAALFSFNYQVTLEKNFTRDRGQLEQRLRALKSEAGTCLYDAMLIASEHMETRDGRHVMIIVTDGGDTTSSTDFHKALRAAQMADAVIYPVLVMPITNDAGRNIGGENALTTMALSTGGRVFVPGLGASLDKAFSDIITDLRTQYLLGYYPKDVPLTKNRFHKLEVRLKRPDLRVSARNGYYGDAEGDALRQ